MRQVSCASWTGTHVRYLFMCFPLIQFKCHDEGDVAHKVYRRSLMAAADGTGVSIVLLCMYLTNYPGQKVLKI